MGLGCGWTFRDGESRMSRASRMSRIGSVVSGGREGGRSLSGVLLEKLPPSLPSVGRIRMSRVIRDFAVDPRCVSRIIRENGVGPGRKGLAAGGEKGDGAGQDLAGEGDGFGNVENLGAGGRTG
jgi:hypothetical protein